MSQPLETGVRQTGHGTGASAGSGGASGTGDIVGIATGLAGDIANTAVEQGRTLLDSARGQAVGFADQQKDSAAQSVADLASSLRQSGETFEDRPAIQAFVGSAADGLDQLAEGLRNRTFAEIYADVEQFARERPAVVGVATVMAGFLLARFIKSSGQELSATAEARRGGSPRAASGSAGSSRARSSLETSAAL